MKQNLLMPAILIATVVGASGCTETAATAPSFFPFPQAMGLEGAAVLSTGKTISDHIVSFSTGKNCSTVRKNIGQHYCEEDEVENPDEVFCYNTLGNVTCYASPAPHGETQRHLGQTPGGNELSR